MDTKKINSNPTWVFSISIITILGTVAGIIPLISESKTAKVQKARYGVYELS